MQPHSSFPNNNEIQIILQDYDRRGEVEFRDIIRNGNPTGENIFEAFKFIVEHTDLQLMKYLGATNGTVETFITQYNMDNADDFRGQEETGNYIYCKYMVSNFNNYLKGRNFGGSQK